MNLSDQTLTRTGFYQGRNLTMSEAFPHVPAALRRIVQHFQTLNGGKLPARALHIAAMMDETQARAAFNALHVQMGRGPLLNL